MSIMKSKDSSSRIPWLHKVVRFIQDDDGLEGWMKRFLHNTLTVLEDIVRRAGQSFIAAVTAKVITIDSQDIPGEQKLAKVLTAIKEEGIKSAEELSTSDTTTLVNAIVSDLKAKGTLS